MKLVKFLLDKTYLTELVILDPLTNPDCLKALLTVGKEMADRRMVDCFGS